VVATAAESVVAMAVATAEGAAVLPAVASAAA
jgi:hypothetical protein